MFCRQFINALRRSTISVHQRRFTTETISHASPASPVSPTTQQQEVTHQLLNKPKPWEDSALLGKNAQKPLEQKPLTGPNQHTGEFDGPQGPEPTRYGDYERSGRCYDF